jgi:hypothetical protein
LKDRQKKRLPQREINFFCDREREWPAFFLIKREKQSRFGMNRFSASEIKQIISQKKTHDQRREINPQSEYCYYRHSNRYGASTAPQFAFKILMIHILQLHYVSHFAALFIEL